MNSPAKYISKRKAGKGDLVVNRADGARRGRINECNLSPRVSESCGRKPQPDAKTVYEVKFPGEVLQIFDAKEIDKVAE